LHRKLWMRVKMRRKRKEMRKDAPGGDDDIYLG
jgi:hypothetical protein